MKKALTLLLIFALVLSMAATAFATDDIEDETHTIITTWDDLLTAVNDASDGDVIYIGTNIEITESAIVGSEDKHITLRLDSSYEDNLSGVFGTSSQYDNMEEILSTELAFINITFDGGNYRCCPLFSINRGVAIKDCTFVDWNAVYGGGFITFGVNSFDYAASIVQDCIFDSIYTNIAALNIGWGAEVNISGCQFKNITGVNGSAISNMGTAVVGVNYFQDCFAENVDALIYNQNVLHLTTDMEAYKSFYEKVPFGWYCNYLFDKSGRVYEPETVQPYSSPDGTLLCGLTLMMENPIETPSEPPEQPNDPEPIIIYRNVYVRVPVYVEKEPEPVEPALVCGDAVIDVSRSVKLEGYDDGLLHLEDHLTRAQFAKILCGLLDGDTLDRYKTYDTVFDDVAPEAWYCPYVNTIAAAGIVCGTGNGNFDPEGVLTWAHIITVLSRFVEPQDYTLQNIQYDGWALDSVKTAVSLGWIADHAAFNPDAAISRGELAYFVNYVLGLYR